MGIRVKVCSKCGRELPTSCFKMYDRKRSKTCMHCTVHDPSQRNEYGVLKETPLPMYVDKDEAYFLILEATVRDLRRSCAAIFRKWYRTGKADTLERLQIANEEFFLSNLFGETKAHIIMDGIKNRARDQVLAKHGKLFTLEE